MLDFQLLKTDPSAPERGYEGSHARRGTLTLNHGMVQTPIFMPVGTYGTVKGVMLRSLHEMGRRLFWATRFIFRCGLGKMSCGSLVGCISLKLEQNYCHFYRQVRRHAPVQHDDGDGNERHHQHDAPIPSKPARKPAPMPSVASSIINWGSSNILRLGAGIL
jgi:Queuine tRNA-ribosyltransferase